MQRKIQNSILFIVGILSISLFSSCYDEIDGCLDVLSVNFKVDADNEVDSLCKYPKVVLAFSPVYGDTIMYRSKVYENMPGSKFAIISLTTLISNVIVWTSSQEAVILDTIEFDYFDSNKILQYRIAQTQEDINFASSLLAYENFKMPDDYGSLSFQFGMTPKENAVDTSTLNQSTNLSKLVPQFYRGIDTGFVQQRLRFVRDSLHSDTFDLIWFGRENVIEYSFDLDQNVPLRENLRIDLNWDFEKWVEGIDFAADSLDIIKNRLRINTLDCIKIAKK